MRVDDDCRDRGRRAAGWPRHHASTRKLYVPHAQFRPFWQDSTQRDFTVVVRTTPSRRRRSATVRRHVRELDSSVPIARVMTMENVVGQSVAGRRLHLVLLGTFAAIALVLAVVGTYGVLPTRPANARASSA